MENNYIDLETSIQNIFSTSRAIIKNNKMLKISRMRFKAGVTNQREIVNLQRDLKQSQINYLDAIKNYNISIAKLQRSTGLTKLEKCKPKNLEKDLNSFDEYSLYTLPIIPIDKACEISLSINSLYEIKTYTTNKNEPKKVINKIDDKNDSTILDSYIPKNKTLNDPKVKDNKENINNKNLKDSNSKNNEENMDNISKDLETENKKIKNTKKLNFKFKKIDKNDSSDIENTLTCSTLIKDSDICLDNFLE